MINQRSHPSNLSTSEETAGEKFLRELDEMPYDNSRVGQAFVMLSPKQNKEMTHLSEKELNKISNEQAIQAIMSRSGKTREEVELMLNNPF
jgi:phosphoribosylaminoimidazole-succinocarboxamide synthase